MEDHYLDIIIPVVWTSIIIVSLIGNGSVLFIMIKRRLIKKSCTNCYISNVAMADLLFTLVVVPLTTFAYSNTDWPFGEFVCRFLDFIINTLVQATCLTLTAMTIDRYIAILYPIKSINFRTKKVVFSITISIWIAAFILATPYFAFRGVRLFYDEANITNNETSKLQCVFLNKDIEKITTTFTIIISYILPLTIILICYIQIIMEFRNNGAFMQRKRKMSVLIATVCITFALLWLPVHVIRIWKVLFEEHFPFTDAMYIAKIIAHTLSYSNSCANPFIYVFMGRRFRLYFQMELQNLKNLLCCFKKQR